MKILSADVEGESTVEVAWAVMPEFQRRGFASELAEESLRIGFDILGLPDIVSFTLIENVASRGVMEKAGFAYERDFVHANLDHVLYRIDQATWQRRRAGETNADG